MNIYVVQGGIGKHVMFSSLIEKLAEKDGEKILVVSAYSDLFKFHPKVEFSADFGQAGFYDKYVKETEHKIIYSEPYYSGYVRGKTHLIQNWAELYGVNYENDVPDIYMDDYSLEECERFVEDFPNFIITQFSGGQSPINADLSRPFTGHNGQIRDYPRELAQEVVNKIKKKYPDMTIVNYSMPNESTYNLKDTTPLESPYLFYVSLATYCKSFISIDSSLQHFAANRYNQKQGVVIWGSTSPDCLGYSKNINLTNKSTEDHVMRPLCSPLGDIFNEDGSPWSFNDADCTKVSPNDIVKAVETTMKNNDKVDVDKSNIVKNTSMIDVNEKTRNMLTSIEIQMRYLNDKYQAIIDTYVASQDKEGRYNLSKDGKKLIKAG
jgi:hypothetical protein